MQTAHAFTSEREPDTKRGTQMHVSQSSRTHHPRKRRCARPTFAHSTLAPCALLVGFATSATAWASEVRVMTLAQPAGIDDEAMVFTYPSLVNRYSLALAEFGTAANQEAYVAAMTQTSAGSFGAAFSRDQSAFNSLNLTTNSTNDNDFIASNFARYSFARKYASNFGIVARRPIDLFYGRPLETDKGFGVRLTLAGDTNEVSTTAATTKKNAEQLDFAFGFHMPASTGRIDLGLALGILGKLENSTAPKTGDKTETTYDRGITARFSGRWVETQATTLKPYLKASLEYATPKLKVSAAGTTETKKSKDVGFDAQGGVLVAPNERTQLNAGAGAFFLQSEGPFALAAPAGTAIEEALRAGTETVTPVLTGPRATRKAYGLALNAGAEALVTESIGVLTGVNYMLWGRVVTKNKAGAGEPQYTTNLTETSDADLWSLGVFYKREALRFDAATALKRFIHNGPHFITGTSTPNIVAWFAASYRF